MPGTNTQEPETQLPFPAPVAAAAAALGKRRRVSTHSLVNSTHGSDERRYDGNPLDLSDKQRIELLEEDNRELHRKVARILEVIDNNHDSESPLRQHRAEDNGCLITPPQRSPTRIGSPTVCRCDFTEPPAVAHFAGDPKTLEKWLIDIDESIKANLDDLPDGESRFEYAQHHLCPKIQAKMGDTRCVHPPGRNLCVKRKIACLGERLGVIYPPEKWTLKPMQTTNDIPLDTRTDWKALGVCMGCGSSMHWAKNCPYDEPYRPRKLN